MADVQVRRIVETDAEALRELGARSTDGGRVAFTQRHRVTVMESMRARRPDSAGFVAVAAGGGLVGSGWVTYSRVQNRDGQVPLAWLHSLNVDPTRRGEGIAAALTRARLDHVAERPEPSVVGAAIQGGNEASLANARRWADRELGAVRVTPVPRPRRAPAALTGLAIRAATDEDLPQVSAGILGAAKAQALSPAPAAEQLAAWLGVRVGGQPLNEYVIATDSNGRVVAGLGVEDESRLFALEVSRLPRAVVAANLVLRAIPADRTLRNLNVRMPWHLPGFEDAARQLWRWTRWAYRDRGTGLVLTADPAGPWSGVFGVPRWLPSAHLRILVREPDGIRIPATPLGPAL